MSDTPRTDASEQEMWAKVGVMGCADAELARELERENARHDARIRWILGHCEVVFENFPKGMEQDFRTLESLKEIDEAAGLAPTTSPQQAASPG